MLLFSQKGPPIPWGVGKFKASDWSKLAEMSTLSNLDENWYVGVLWDCEWKRIVFVKIRGFWLVEISTLSDLDENWYVGVLWDCQWKRIVFVKIRGFWLVEMSTLSDLDENWYVSFYGTANERKLFSSISEASDWSKCQLCPIWMKIGKFLWDCEWKQIVFVNIRGFWLVKISTLSDLDENGK